MLLRHQVRRIEARLAAQRYTLTDPLFNFREISKQMILLEDHLSHPYKLCPDCVRKHLLTIEALAEEASALDHTGIFQDTGEDLAERARQWIEGFEDGQPPTDIAQGVREVRKNLTPFCADPRGEAQRVASVWLQRGVCPHRMVTSQ